MLSLRPIRPSDNETVAKLIREVMTEFNCVGEGYSINDPELRDMYAAYSRPGSDFYVLTSDGDIVGVGGFAPLAHADESVCELRKMYLQPAARGKGGGRLILERCLEGARKHGYRRMYLETVHGMATAGRMYSRYGFTPLDGPLGNTGHSSCDRYMIHDL
ncbi:GNAT family N-acetyltransferase [Lewinella sp. IMCC34191]|uniref:GNAT family N-acetyltransferase n=1 Tax=Lewinella sp. IMCC34191 TaxID=2259172 RepID=UPI000E24197A|nr:GNAT family N-acetyltransferase [Lewinella sp. IMCC34191]